MMVTIDEQSQWAVVSYARDYVRGSSRREQIAPILILRSVQSFRCLWIRYLPDCRGSLSPLMMTLRVDFQLLRPRPFGGGVALQGKVSTPRAPDYRGR